MGRTGEPDMAITRTDGTKLINKVFSELDTARAHYSDEGFDFIPGMKELRDAVTIIMKLRKSSDYNYWLNNLDISEYEKYFKKVTELAAIFSSKQASKMQSSDFLKLRDLASAFGKTSKYEKRLEIINTFSLDDLQNWGKDYPEKEGLLIQLLDKWFMNDDGKDTINKFLSSFSHRDKEKFIEKTITNPEILELLLKKINMGDEKNNLLKTFVSFGTGTNIDKNEYDIPKGKVFNASFVDKKMYLNLLKPVPYEDNMYDIEKQVKLPTPFTKVNFYYGGDNRISVPAISLIGRNFDDVLYDDFYKNNINLAELTNEEKEALFTEFVQHYLGKAFIAEYLSNPLGLLKSIGITIAIGILLLFASEALTIGIAIAGSAYGSIVSALSLRSGLGMLGGANEEKQNAANINDFKIAAKHTAEAMIKIGVNAISLITSLIQFGEACWKGGKLYYKNKKLLTDNQLNKNVEARTVLKTEVKSLDEKLLQKIEKSFPKHAGKIEKIVRAHGDDVLKFIEKNGNSKNISDITKIFSNEKNFEYSKFMEFMVKNDKEAIKFMKKYDVEVLKKWNGELPKYWKSRPAYAKASEPGKLDQVEQVWKNAKETHRNWTENGVEYIDMGDEIGEVSWDKTKTRNGQWDMGHVENEEYWREYDRFVKGELSEDKFLEWYHKSEIYEPQTIKYNRSHTGEKK